MGIFCVSGYSKEDGISICKFEKGKIIKLIKFDNIEDPSSIIVNEDIAYVGIEKDGYQDSNGGSVLTLHLKDNIIEQKNIYDTNIKGVCHISINNDKSLLCASSYSEGKLALFHIEKDKLNLKLECITNPNSKEGKMHFTYFSKIENKLYAVDLGNDTIFIYNLIIEKGSIYLKVEDHIKLDNKTGPRQIAFTKDENTMYVITEISNQIQVFKKGENNKFENIQKISTLAQNKEIKSYAAAIVLSEDGKNIYASNRGDNSIAVYLVNDKNKLELLQIIPCGGDYPWDIKLDKEENFLLCANQKSDLITVMKRNKDNGALILTEERLRIKKPSCISFQ